MFRWWMRSALRAVQRAESPRAPTAPAIPDANLSGEVAELRAEVARLRAAREERTEDDISPPRHTIH